jgi:mono/diheme cytochrome c family protein
VRASASVLLGALLVAAAGAGARAQGPDPDLGRRVYEANCAICHGPRGDGQGHAAHHFRAAPRDFTQGRYKLRSTPSGQPPTDDDLRAAIVRGLPGTGMVPQDHLADAEVAAVIAFIKDLSPRFARAPAPSPLPIPSAPARGADALARGRRAYHRGECAECHGREARGDGPSAKDLKVKPSDLTRRPFKGGDTPRDIVRALLTGYDGTPMPSYHLVLDDDELWHLAWWIESIGGPPEVTPDERAGWHVVRMHQGRRPR